jgi:hypothetical protein
MTELSSPEKKAPPRKTKEFVYFMFAEIVRKRKWFLLPVWVLLVVVAVILFLTGNTHLLPAIYIAF